ncbi:MAG: NAD-dependent epimerase/dehydratase family protein, partial [Pyrinomonadaceae bacterium]
LRGEPLTLYGAGDQTRSFCYVDDLVGALIKLMNVPDVHDPVNLGNPGEFTIKQLAEEVVKICDSKSGVKYLPLPEDDPKQRKPDISRAQTLLDWNPTIPLNEGLKKTVADFKQRVRDKQLASKEQ